MKKIAALILTGILAFGCFSTAFAAETKVSVDGVPVVFTDAKPFVDENGRTMVPLRPIANAMGLEVAWDATTQTAAFTTGLPDEWIETTEDIYEAFGAVIRAGEKQKPGEEKAFCLKKFDEIPGIWAGKMAQARENQDIKAIAIEEVKMETARHLKEKLLKMTEETR